MGGLKMQFSFSSMKKIILSFLTACVFGAHIAPAFAQENSALYKAARLRYLSTRIAKAYAQAALDVRSEKAAEIIANSVKQSQTLIGDLKKSGHANPEVRVALADFEMRATLLYSDASAKPNANKALDISKLSEDAFKAGNNLAAAYEGLEKNPFAKLQNTAGRQRGLSQRIARDFFVMKLGKSNSFKTDTAQWRSEFKTALDILTNAPLSTPAIKNNLMLVQTQWMFFEQSIDNPNDPTSAVNVATTSERIIEVLDDLVDQYDTVMHSLK
jgi:hypothetical protein